MAAGTLLITLGWTLAQAPMEPPPSQAPPVVTSEKPVQADPRHDAPSPARLVGGALLGAAAGVVVALPFLAAAGAAGAGWGFLSGTVAGDALLPGLLLGLLGPLGMTVIALPGLVAGALVGTGVARLVAGPVFSSRTSLATAGVAGVIGMVVGWLLHEAGLALALALGFVIWLMVLLIQLVLGALCAAFCGRNTVQPINPFTFNLGREARSQTLVGMVLWSLAWSLPVALAGLLGVTAGAAGGSVVGGTAEALSDDNLEQPPEKAPEAVHTPESPAVEAGGQ